MSKHAPHTHQLMVVVRGGLYQVLYGENEYDDAKEVRKVGFFGQTRPRHRRWNRVARRAAKKAIRRHDRWHERVYRNQTKKEAGTIKELNQLLAQEPGDMEQWGTELIKKGVVADG